MWLRNFFTGRSQCAKVGGTLSEFVDMLSGVIQGSALGPLLVCCFSLSSTNLLRFWKSMVAYYKVKLFADDVKLYVKLTNDVDLCVLQAAINALCQWADTWQLSISVEKNCALSIGKKLFQVHHCPSMVPLYHVETLESLSHQI